jgi:hypothetical protein
MLAPRPRTRPGARFVPRLEALEDRTVLSPTFTTLSVSPSPAVLGQPVTLSATVHRGDFTPGTGIGGFIIYRDGTAVIGAGPVGSPSITVLLSPGTHSLTATYSGERQPGVGGGVNDPSQSDAVTEVVQAAVGDVTSHVRVTLGGVQPVTAGRGHRPVAHRFQVPVTLTNIGTIPIQGPIVLVLNGLPSQVTLLSPAGSSNGSARIRFEQAQLNPGASLSVTLVFKANTVRAVKPILITAQVLAGPGVV